MLINLADDLKTKEQHGIPQRFMSGKHIALIFEKQSTRTRSAFTVAATKLGANVEYLNKNDIQLGSKESVEDTAKVLGRMFDGIAYRGSEQATVEALGAHANIPIWNALTDDWHPTQMVGDFETELVREFFYAISYSAGMNLHVKVLDGLNSHHIAEAMFKAFGKALDEACTKDERITFVLSTKGSL